MDKNKVNRTYKSRLFEMIFSDRKELLGLYNAVNQTKYEDPTPHFLVFYNGREERPDREVLLLSSAFYVPEEDIRLELKAVVLNINAGHNTHILEACKTLQDYAEYTSRVRAYAETMGIEEAVERAVTECIAQDILAEFLSRNKAEAIKVSIYEYDQEEHMRQEREASREEGIKEGIKEGRLDMVCHALRNGISEEQLIKLLGVTEEEIMEARKILKG